MIYFFPFVCSLLRLVVWSRVKLVETQGWSKCVVVKVRGHEEGERNTTNKSFVKYVCNHDIWQCEGGKVKRPGNQRRRKGGQNIGSLREGTEYYGVSFKWLCWCCSMIGQEKYVVLLCTIGGPQSVSCVQIWNQYKRMSFIAREGDFRLQFIFWLNGRKNKYDVQNKTVEK